MTDPRLSADAVFVAGSLTAGFATIGGILGLALLDGLVPLAVGMLVPTAVLLLTVRDYSDRTDRLETRVSAEEET
jgi:hypothetical protein